MRRRGRETRRDGARDDRGGGTTRARRGDGAAGDGGEDARRLTNDGNADLYDDR